MQWRKATIYYARGFSVSEVWTGHSGDSLTLLHRVRGFSWEGPDGWGWNHLEASLLTYLVPGLGWLKVWAQLGLSTGAPTCGFSVWPGRLTPCSWFLRQSTQRPTLHIQRGSLENPDREHSRMAFHGLPFSLIVSLPPYSTGQGTHRPTKI